MRKVSDKYILQRFFREFDQISQMGSEENNLQEEGQEAQAPAKVTSLNYLKFKNFMINYGFLSEQQALTNSLESQLITEVWNIIAPVKQANEEEGSGSDTGAKAEEVSIEDLKVIVMAILRVNDGKRFVNASEAPAEPE